MADFELTPEAIQEEAQTAASELATDVQEVAAQAAAIDLAPMVDIEADAEESREKAQLIQLPEATSSTK